MNWEIEKLEELCIQNTIKFPNDRINYFGNKIKRYYFIRDDFSNTFKKYFNENKKSHKIDSNIILLDYSYSNILELTSTIICSTFDIIGFIINTILLNDCIKDRDVSFNKVLNELKSKNIYLNIKDDMEKLKNLYSYKYMISFNNIIKHRGIIGHFTKLGISENFLKDLSLPFVENFQFNNEKFVECSANDFFEYGNECVKNIIEIGCKINNELS